ncbi:MAG: transposase [Nitrososphaera sp.]|nr:transposase [Nitrososphaera sp.]
MPKLPKQTLEQWAIDNSLPYATALSLFQSKNLPYQTSVDIDGNIFIYPTNLVRSIKLSLKFLTKTKRRKLRALLEAYTAAVNFYIKSLWKVKGRADKTTLARLQNTRLSERYKSQALRQALSIVSSTHRSAKELKVKAKCPKFSDGAKLDAKCVSIDEGDNSFDLWLRLSTLNKGSPINLPTKATKVLRKWLSRENASIIQGCELHLDYLIIWVELPYQPIKPEGSILAIDLGEVILAADSDKNFYGKELQAILDKIKRRKQGSKGQKQARIERDNYINRCLKRLPWKELRFLGKEKLNGIKKGRTGKKKYKSFRKARAPWNQGWVRTRINHLAQENRVLSVNYDPRNTSRKCPMCSEVHEGNRQGRLFRCLFCGYSEHSDYVGALNGVASTRLLLGSLESPKPTKDDI